MSSCRDRQVGEGLQRALDAMGDQPELSIGLAIEAAFATAQDPTADGDARAAAFQELQEAQNACGENDVGTQWRLSECMERRLRLKISELLAHGPE